MRPQRRMPKHGWERATCSTGCLHRWWLLCQMVHLHVWMKIRSTTQSQSQEAARDTRWPDACSDMCSSEWRAAHTTLPESQKKRKKIKAFKKINKKNKCSPAHAAAVHVHPMASGIYAHGSLELHSHLWGNGRNGGALSSLCNNISFWNLLHSFKSSMKVAESAERIRKVTAETRTKQVKKTEWYSWQRQLIWSHFKLIALHFPAVCMFRHFS